MSISELLAIAEDEAGEPVAIEFIPWGAVSQRTIEVAMKTVRDPHHAISTATNHVDDDVTVTTAVRMMGQSLRDARLCD